jgi:hypothetical protein
LAVLQAVLLVGFFQEEVDQFRSMMLEMEADMVKVREHLLGHPAA